MTTDLADVEPVDIADVRARRHPFAIVALWFFELVAAFLIATPVHAWAKSAYGGHPDGDQPLFRHGGYALLGWLDTDGPDRGVVFRTTAVTILFFALVSTVVTGALVATLATRGGKRFSFALRTGAASFFPMLATGIVFGAIEGFFLGLGFFLSSGLDHRLQDSYGDQRAFLARLALFGVFLVFVLASGVVGDLARVAVARSIALGTSEKPLRDGIVTAIRTARRKIGRACLAWGWRSAVATALIVVGAMLNDWTHTRAGGALWLLFFAHQAIIFARAALRASWLANALRLVDDEAP